MFILTNIFGVFFQGVVGFGHGVITIPLSLTFLDKNTTLTSAMIIGFAMNLYLMLKIKEPLDKKIFWPLMLGSLIGMPVGIYILKIIPINTLRVLVGFLSIIFTIAILFARVKIHGFRFVTPFMGFICGILQTSISMPGPLLVVFLYGINMPKHNMRKILVTFFLYLSIIALPLYFISDVITSQGIFYGILSLPFIVMAAYFGNRAANKIPSSWYKTIALITVFATGAFAIYSGIR